MCDREAWVIASLWIAAAWGAKVELACPPAGTIARYNITTERSAARGPGSDFAVTSAITATHRLEVLASSATQVRVSMRTESGAWLSSPHDPVMGEVQLALAGLKGVDVVYVFDVAKGTLEVEDAAPLVLGYAKLLQGLEQAHPARASELNALRGSLLHPDTLKVGATQRLAPLARLGCGSFETSAARAGVYLPDVFGGAWMRGIATRTVHVKGDTVSFSVDEVPQPEAVTEKAAELAKTWSLPTGTPLTLDIHHEVRATGARGHPWLDGWQVTRTATSEHRSVREVVRVERQPVE